MATEGNDPKFVLEEKSNTEQQSEEDTVGDTIENDGVRMIHLRDALRKTIKKCIDSAKFSTFNKHYGRHMADRKPQALKSLVQQFKEQLEKSIKEELEVMIDEENLVHLFNELDRVVDSASSESDLAAWRPTGEPEKDCQNHIVKEKLKEKERLERVLQEVEAEGDRLQEVIRGQKQKLVKTQNSIKEQLEMFSQADEACDQVPVTELEKTLHQLSKAPIPPDVTQYGP